MKPIVWAGIIMASALTLVACGSSSSESLIDPTNQPEELAQGLTVKVGGASGVARNSKDTPIPPPSTDPAAPTVQTAPTNDVDVANGDTAKADIVFNSAANLSGLFAKVVGADSYVEFALGGAAKASSALSFDITVPANTRDGRFCIDIVGRDSEGLVSQPKRICYQVRSDRDDENSADQVRSQLQGSWQGICDAFGSSSERSLLSINNNNFSETQQNFDNANCSGSPISEDIDSGIFVLGSELLTVSGIKARELDVMIDGVGTYLDIVRVQADQLLFGISSEGRPNQLDFDSPYTRSSGTTPTQDNTALGDQTWRLSIAVKGTIDGESVDQSLGSFEVSGLEVPQDNASGQQQSISSSEAYAQGFEAACENGFDENQPTRIDNFSYSQTGNGGVGSVIDWQIDIFVDGVCRQSDGDDTIKLDVMYMYRFERIS